MVKKNKNNYSLLEKLQLMFWLLRTKLIAPKARLLRFPLVIRGRKYIDFGESLTTGVGCRFDCFSGNKPDEVKLKFGKDVQLNDYVHLVAMESISIGNNVLMASHIFISDNSHGSYKSDVNDSNPQVPPIEREYVTNPVIIGNNVWIGEGVCVMPGVTIGDGCVIGAHSIVTHDIPENTIAVGAPAKVVKRYNNNTKHWEKLNEENISYRQSRIYRSLLT